MRFLFSFLQHTLQHPTIHLRKSFKSILIPIPTQSVTGRIRRGYAPQRQNFSQTYILYYLPSVLQAPASSTEHQYNRENVLTRQILVNALVQSRVYCELTQKRQPRMRCDQIIGHFQLDPKSCILQSYGGIGFGIGFALSEEGIFAPKTGTLLSTNLHQHKMLTSLDAPDIHAIFTENENTHFAYSAEEAGENTNPQ